jgi:hypothetical protein
MFDGGNKKEEKKQKFLSMASHNLVLLFWDSTVGTFFL